MKKVVLLVMLSGLFASCDQGAKRYTQSSPEIDTVKKLIANYNNKTYDTSIYADTSKTYYNTKKNAMSPAETMEFHKQSDANYAERGFLDAGQEYEMVLTDDGETWVNCWLDWKGSMAVNDKEFEIPIHLTYRFIDGKIVREVGHWDPTELVMALQEHEKQENASVEEKTISSVLNAVTQAWNLNDKNAMASSMTSNFIRTENGKVLTQNPAEYASQLMDVYHAAFPDFKVTLDNVMIMGNKAYCSWTCTGTNSGPFQGNDATNKPIKTHGFSIWTINKEGKAVREDAYYDNMVVFQQLGFVIAPVM